MEKPLLKKISNFFIESMNSKTMVSQADIVLRSKLWFTSAWVVNDIKTYKMLNVTKPVEATT